MVKIQYANNRYFITLPKELVERKGWKKGESLFFIFNERGNIEIMGAEKNVKNQG